MSKENYNEALLFVSGFGVLPLTALYQNVKIVEFKNECCRKPMQITGFLFFLTAISVWLLILSILVVRLLALFNRLTKGVEVSDLKTVLEKVLTRGDENKKEIGILGRRIDYLESDGRGHIQKIGLVRFNPFRELGGDHSFSLAILDAQDSGIIITSLHTRDRTRVYMKDIKKGKSESALSDEEKKALTVAQKR